MNKIIYIIAYFVLVFFIGCLTALPLVGVPIGLVVIGAFVGSILGVVLLWRIV